VGAADPEPDVKAKVSETAKPYQFDMVEWEIGAILNKLRGARMPVEYSGLSPEAIVVEYFVLGAELRALRAETPSSQPSDADSRFREVESEMRALADIVEDIMQEQIGEALLTSGISGPIPVLDLLPVVLPPVLFQLEEPPKLLVISRRDRIESIQRITLRQEITLDERKAVETECDKLGVSALVVDLGGIATYPSFVVNDATLRFTFEAAAEEWVHAYFTFRPLGFVYLLDLIESGNREEVRSINETAAGIVNDEIAGIVIRKHYPGLMQPSPPSSPPSPITFDYNREMRITRQQVDAYLEKGEIENAEQYMEARRQVFESNGYPIRKLNQAYFAFHGTYAYSPASVSPAYRDLKEVRAHSASLKDFVDAVSVITSYEELQKLVMKLRSVSSEVPAPQLAAAPLDISAHALSDSAVDAVTP